MTPAQKLDEEFRHYVRRPLDQWELIEGALLVARQEYPDWDPEPCRTQVREMAREAAARMAGGGGREGKLERLNRYFFGEWGFRGNREDYGDPRNSYLPDVLQRRTGIPITLCVLYLKCAWEAGCPLFGINFPGHFLVAWKESEIDVASNLYLDVFNGGEILGPAGLEARLSERAGERVRLEPALHLRNAGIRDILHRMLANLKAAHASRRSPERALWAAEWMLLLKPDDWGSLRDKGFFCYALGRRAEAEAALETYLDKTRRPPDYALVTRLLYALRAGNPVHLN